MEECAKICVLNLYAVTDDCLDQLFVRESVKKKKKKLTVKCYNNVHIIKNLSAENLLEHLLQLLFMILLCISSNLINLKNFHL